MSEQSNRIDDAQFGRLDFDARLNWYTGTVTWEGGPVTLHVSMDEAQSLSAVLEVARALWKSSATWDTRIKDFAADRLLALKNESWLDEDEAEVSRSDFIARMQLESITVYPGGEFDFMHADGDLFRGHCIAVAGDLEEGPNDADIPG